MPQRLSAHDPWAQLRLILATTNLVRDLAARRTLAEEKKLRALQGSLLDRNEADDNWATAFIPIGVAAEIIPKGCLVGPNGVELAHCVQDARHALAEQKLDLSLLTAKIARFKDMVGVDLKYHAALPQAMWHVGLTSSVIASCAVDAQYGEFVVGMNMKITQAEP